MDPIGRLICDGVPVGTAFLAAPGGLAVTAAHVITGEAGANWAFEPLTASGISLPAILLERDPGADTALIQVTGADDYQPVPLISHVSATPGDLIHLRGFAGVRHHDSGVGCYVGEIEDKGRSWVKVSCRHAQPGMSGAPVVLTGTGSAIGVVSARLNAGHWNRDTVLLARTEDVVALAPRQLRLASSARRLTGGTLRLSWVRGNQLELIVETGDFGVSFGRHSANRVHLPDHRDHRFHGQLMMAGAELRYHQLGEHAVVLSGATRQVTIEQGVSCSVGDKERLHFASGTVLVECSMPDLFDPNAGPTSTGEPPERPVGH